MRLLGLIATILWCVGTFQACGCVSAMCQDSEYLQIPPNYCTTKDFTLTNHTITFINAVTKEPITESLTFEMVTTLEPWSYKDTLYMGYYDSSTVFIENGKAHVEQYSIDTTCGNGYITQNISGVSSMSYQSTGHPGYYLKSYFFYRETIPDTLYLVESSIIAIKAVAPTEIDTLNYLTVNVAYSKNGNYSTGHSFRHSFRLEFDSLYEVGDTLIFYDTIPLYDSIAFIGTIYNYRYGPDTNRQWGDHEVNYRVPVRTGDTTRLNMQVNGHYVTTTATMFDTIYNSSYELWNREYYNNSFASAISVPYNTVSDHFFLNRNDDFYTISIDTLSLYTFKKTYYNSVNELTLVVYDSTQKSVSEGFHTEHVLPKGRYTIKVGIPDSIKTTLLHSKDEYGYSIEWDRYPLDKVTEHHNNSYHTPAIIKDSVVYDNFYYSLNDDFYTFEVDSFSLVTIAATGDYWQQLNITLFNPDSTIECERTLNTYDKWNHQRVTDHRVQLNQGKYILKVGGADSVWTPVYRRRAIEYGVMITQSGL